MNITARVLAFLLELRLRYFATARQLQRWHLPNDKDGSTTRELLRKMESAGLVRRLKAEVHDPLKTPTAPVWVITETGSCVLSMQTGDPSLVMEAMPNTRNWTAFRHYTEIAEFTKDVDLAFGKQDYAKKGPWRFEHEIISNEKSPEHRYRLYLSQQVNGRRIVCNADVAMEVKVEEFCRAYYIEYERGTDTPNRVAAKKSPGYGILSQHFKRHFPDAQDWRVIFVWPTAAMRDAARRAADPANTEWLFAARPDINEDFLHQPVIYTANGDAPKPLIAPPTTPQPPMQKGT